MLKKNFISAVSLFALCFSAQAAVWEPLDTDMSINSSNSPSKQLYYVDLTSLSNQLTGLHYKKTSASDNNIIELPTADGSIQNFRFEQSTIMEASLAARYPEIKTYKIQGIDDPQATGRLSISPLGFNAMIRSGSGSFYIDHENNEADEAQLYRAYKYTGNSPEEQFQCEVRGHDNISPLGKMAAADNFLQQDLKLPEDRQHEDPAWTHRQPGQLHLYRLAVSATYEFVQYTGGTKATALASIVATVNRIIDVYERDLGITFVLIDGLEPVLFTTSNDPYSGSNDDRITQNQTVMRSFGREKFDIGHLFGNGGGGVADLGSACNQIEENYDNTTETYKASGGSFTGSSSVNKASFAMLVAHEMGHQFGASHSYSGGTSYCDNRSTGVYEPGSGSTIMAYPGSCGAENVQTFKDAMFHAVSIKTINRTTYLRTMTPSAQYGCNNFRQTSNINWPTINAGSDYTIPVSTPFELTAAGSDADNDTLTYSWDERDEQYSKDERQASRTNSSTFGIDLGKNSLMRSRMPQADNKRYFPQIKTIMGETTDQERKTEALPTTNRTIQFRSFVRDGKGGQVFDDVILTSTTAAGPFKVTSHSNAANINAGSSSSVYWNVAGTSGGAVNCPNVDISMLMFDSNASRYCEQPLTSSTANDGSAVVKLPNLTTPKARFKVSCSNNVFFALSQGNININGSVPAVNCAAPGPQNNTPDISSLYYLLL